MKRFSVRTLLLAVGGIALLIWAGLLLHARFTSVPLPEAIATANARLHELELPLPPLTEADVIASIESQLPKIPDRAQGIYRRIARTQRLPANAALDGPTHTSKPGQWSVNLDVMYDAKKGYALRVYEGTEP